MLGPWTSASPVSLGRWELSFIQARTRRRDREEARLLPRGYPCWTTYRHNDGVVTGEPDTRKASPSGPAEGRWTRTCNCRHDHQGPIFVELHVLQVATTLLMLCVPPQPMGTPSLSPTTDRKIMKSAPRRHTSGRDSATLSPTPQPKSSRQWLTSNSDSRCPGTLLCWHGHYFG
jgi:hypothetical protein